MHGDRAAHSFPIQTADVALGGVKTHPPMDSGDLGKRRVHGPMRFFRWHALYPNADQRA